MDAPVEDARAKRKRSVSCDYCGCFSDAWWWGGGAWQGQRFCTRCWVGWDPYVTAEDTKPNPQTPPRPTPSPLTGSGLPQSLEVAIPRPVPRPLTGSARTGAGKCAYVSLLHGDRDSYLLYALVLGNQLRRLDAATPRVLLVGKPLPDAPASNLSDRSIDCLKCFWSVEKIDLVDAPNADATPKKRHRFVFSKLRVLELPYEKLLFLDLDTLLLKDPSMLFNVAAPAGMHHGYWTWWSIPAQGEIQPEEELEDGCINAGMLRLDTLPTEAARKQQVADMLAEVARITDEEATYLPEQYYLVRKLPGWRQIDVSWNYEVYPSVHVINANDESDEEDGKRCINGRGKRARHALKWSHLPLGWWKLGNCKKDFLERVGMFHFSGSAVQPWWYLRYSSSEAESVIQFEVGARDPRGLISVAVAQWLAALEQLHSTDMPSSARFTLWMVLSRLTKDAEDWRIRRSPMCPRCRSPVLVGSVVAPPHWENQYPGSSCAEAGMEGGTGGTIDPELHAEIKAEAAWVRTEEEKLEDDNWVCEDCAIHSAFRHHCERSGRETTPAYLVEWLTPPTRS